MILEYSIEDIKNIYDEEYNNNLGSENSTNYDNLLCMEQIVSDEIDKYNINCKIHHIFPITISLSAIILLSSYIILY